ncbi:oxysterol-binding protein [Colletotrichum karsti]|uniref:Oxysterol-binding protein n=1 Tax=Colletotrichum karsti TaxID=1095194 RepID=A0A9P6LQA8_9PEZI|nr:oxysterol-binding protein [Colletotrichum karsti]KAF9881985.1 oxysterol-binding protein [Colletotrichum karsti]
MRKLKLKLRRPPAEMAGIEQLEIHSKSYIVRWVKVDEGHTISWSVQPHKKSINFGIVKHPGTGATGLISSQNDDTATSGTLTSGVAEPKGRFGKRDTSTAQEQLASKGFIPVKWHGKCDADKVSTGTWDVLPGQGGMFGLVFDNTFSKQISKTATFVLLTYPTGAPPQTTAHAFPNLQAANASASRTSLPQVTTVNSASQDSLHSHVAGGVRPTSASGRSENANYHTGILHKRRRKKGQGYARRFFSLDYSSCTLSYYYNRNSSALRGAIPLSLAAIAADERRREINIDSGAEIWHLRASNAKDFNDWARALEKASRAARGFEAGEDQPKNLRAPPLRVNTTHLKPTASSMEEDREWQQVETLVSRVVGTRDALRRLVKDMSSQRPVSMAASSFLSPSSVGEENESYFTPPAEQQTQRRPFWRRKSSAATPTPTTPQAHQSSAATALAVPAPGGVTTTITSNGPRHAKSKSKASIHEEKSTQEHCASLLSDLDSVVSEFTTLIANSKRRRAPAPLSAAPSRRSMETASTDEFFDAEAGETSSQIVKISQSEDESPDSEPDEGNLTDSSSISSVPEEDTGVAGQDDSSCYPAKPKSLSPLPVDISVDRRTKIPPALVQPPSLIAFVRKNVGKDLSTISMPVSANEPISLLQRVAEQLEYAQLLDQAARQKESKDRLLYVTAFAVSQFSSGRAKERAIRKPFNPLLGETFEMLRTEQEVPGGFRLVVEKVCHRPVRLAMQADSADWSFSQSPAPSQKFWGKSAEITTEGRVRVALRLPDGTDELYSWTHATMFLRNVVMGEKYVEPVGVMQICNDSTGAKASVEFRSKGMFGGRGEDVQVETYGPDGVHTGSSLSGTWTGGLRVVEAGKAAGQEIWRVGKLVDNAANTYGMTTFAAALNEVTEIEKGRLPPTDSRLRPDQRLAEKGDLDQAEEWKVKLEEAQRARRRVLEEKGEEHKPKWFVKAGQGPEGEEVWKLRTGKDSYWEERSKGTWSGVEDIFSA